MQAVSLVDAEPGEALAALHHRAHGHGLQPVEVGKLDPGRRDRPAQPERLEPLAHPPVEMSGLRLDPGADDIADQAVHRRPRPIGVVPRIPPEEEEERDKKKIKKKKAHAPPWSRPRGYAAFSPLDRPRALPTPPATRSVEAATASRGPRRRMEKGPHRAIESPSKTKPLQSNLGMYCEIRLRTHDARQADNAIYPPHDTPSSRPTPQSSIPCSGSIRSPELEELPCAIPGVGVRGELGP